MQSIEYVLRIWYAQFDTPAKVRGVIEFCRRAGIRQLQMSPADAWQHALSTRAEVVAHCRKLKRILQTLKAGGIEPGYNVGRTFIAGSTAGKKYIGFKQPRVALDGTPARLLPCPLDRIFLRYTNMFYAELARTEPATILPDDDYRYEYLGAGPTCFCPLHLAEFERRYGHKPDREQIREVIQNPHPHPVKNDWMEFKRVLLVELARELRDTVHEANPRVRMGLMLTSTEIAAYEGRDPWELVQTFAGDRRPLVRLAQGCYQDGERLGLMEGLMDSVYQAGLMSADTEKQVEVDFYPHSTFCKSTHFGFDYQFKANLACNFRTINILPFGRDQRVNAEHPFAAIMARKKTILNRMARQIPPDARISGIQVVYSPKAAQLRAQSCAVPYPPAGLSTIAQLLWRWGLPFSFSDAPVAVLTKDSFPMPKEEVERILGSKHVFMDAGALVLVKAMGLNQVGDIDCSSTLAPAALMEEHILSDVRNGDARGFRISITSRSPGTRSGKESGFLRIQTPPRSVWRVLSRLGGEPRKPGSPGMLAAETRGRRLVVSAAHVLSVPGSNPALNRHWANEVRQAQMQSVFSWLYGGVLPAVVRDAPDICPVLLENGTDTRVLSLINMSTGSAEGASVHIAAPGPANRYRVDALTDEGKVIPVAKDRVVRRGGSLRVRLAGESALYPCHVRVLLVRAEPE